MSSFPEASQIPAGGHLHRPASPNGDSLILTHGSGANASAPLLLALANAFCDAGVTVLRYDLPFRQQRPHGPPPPCSATRDQAGLRAAVAFLRPHTSGRIFLGGHSYGGRQSSILCAAEPGLVDCLLLLSYPLHPPKRPAELRTTHFPTLKTPALFVSGARDGFGTLDELAAALKLIPARTELLPIPSAGHELMTPKNRDELPKQVVEAFRAFASSAIA